MPSLVFGPVRVWRSLVLVSLFVISAARAEAGSVTLAWDPSPDTAVVGYTVAYGTQSGHYSSFVNVANATTYTFGSLPDGTYYFAVRAYAQDGTVSEYSNEVVTTVTTSTYTPPTSPTQPSSSCATPDPFVSMGGGTCYNGGWLPPGMSIPGSSAPAPAPAPSVAPKTSTGCQTVDPFAAMGGGTCYNGGWLPPGMAVPGSTAAPAAPAPPPSSSPAPAPSVQGCTSPDPFTAMGGGTCYNGGWLPPGMAIPGGTASSQPPTSPAPPDPPVALNTACSTPDPFVGLGGGSCYQGGWLPPGFAVTVTGTLHVMDLEAGLWNFEAADGTIFTSVSELAADQLIDGALVTLHGLTLPSGDSTDDVIVVEILLIEIHD